MAIIPTGAIYKTLNFDGQSSGTYGVYITGDAVFNAPERDVEMITIPGRNGAFFLDNGRFENIEVTYPAGIFAETEADFAEAISDFRNYLCSRKGYCRLTDDYNPDEYRLGIYKSGLEVDPAFLKAGQFNITFECKPQRFLTSGETEIVITSGDELNNPTYFESSPLLEAAGYGTILFDDKETEILETYLGEVVCAKAQYVYTTKTITLDTSHLVAGDHIYTKATTSVVPWIFAGGSGVVVKIDTASTTMTNGLSYTVETVITNSTYKFSFYPDLSGGFLYGTASTITATVVFHGTYKEAGQPNKSFTFTFDYTASYNGSNQIIIDFPLAVCSAVFDCTYTDERGMVSAFYGDSHEIAPLNQVFIDMDLGEAYGVVNSELISYNNIVSLPAELPQLKPGNNEITYDNTITSLKITPRWWKV